MDISLTTALIGLKSFIHIAETCFEGSMSQNFDIWLSFCFVVCRRRNIGKYDKIHKSYLFFYHKIKTKAYTQNLRHASLDQNVFYTY